MVEPISRAPLKGIRVLDLSTMLAGPFGTQMLGDLGAEIIKIETPSGDNTRNFPPHFHKGESLYYMSFNRNKKSMVIDLKSEAGLALFYQLVKHADVVWDNYRAGVNERLKIDYETLAKLNPAIISASITAYGTGNPYDRHEPTYDLCIQAMSGVLSMTGEAERPPVKLGVPMADIGGGWYAVVGVLAALVARKATGRGQKVDISMLDALTSLQCYEATYYLNSGTIPQRLGTSHRSLVPYQIFKTQDIYLAVVVASDKFWGKLCQAVDAPEMITDQRFATIKARYDNREQLVAWLSSVLETRTCEQWLERMKEAGVPCAPVNTIDRTFREPTLLARDMVVEVEHKGEPVKVLGNPVKLSENVPQKYASPPALGEHTGQVLRDILHMSDQEIYALYEKHVIGLADGKLD